MSDMASRTAASPSDISSDLSPESGTGARVPTAPHPDAPPIEQVVAQFGDLPTLAPVAVEVIRLADDNDASLGDLVDAIGTDPGLTARLLRVANSATYGQTRQVTNLNRATSLLGSHTVKLLSLGFSLVINANDGPVDTGMIWRRSLVSSVLAQRFAFIRDHRLSDDAFVGGLLSNVGALALVKWPLYVSHLPEDRPWMRHSEERALLGYTADEVTSAILASWGMPHTLVEATRHRAEPSNADAGYELAELLQVADAAAQLLLAGDEDARAEAHNHLILTGASNFGVTGGQLEEIITAAGPDLDDIMGMFDLGDVSSTPVSELMILAQTRMAKLSQSLASELMRQEERNRSLIETNQRLSDEAATDPLTGIANRRTFKAYLDNQVGSRLRFAKPSELGLILFDLDNFKMVNDTHGHSVGDTVLREVGQRLSSATRRSDLAARIGGEEFAVVMPDINPNEIALAAERFRTLFGDRPVETSAGELSITVSVGVSHTSGGHLASMEDRERLYTTADAALYESKRAGKNMVTVKPLES